MMERKNQVIVIRRADGRYFQGCGYGGPGHPVPYWVEDIRQAQIYLGPTRAAGAAKRYGGYRGAALAEAGRASEWLGFIVQGRGGQQIVTDVAPADFDPNDYEGNNGPLG